MNTEDRETLNAFKDVVNMTPATLDRWLKTEDSRAVGYKAEGADESVGHKSGARIVEMLNTRQDEHTDADLAHMRKVVGYVRRHLAQRPEGDIRETRWRYSLMNWGHDPAK